MRMTKIFHTLIATWFYSGYLRPASGTWGTLAALPLCIAVAYFFGIVGILIGTVVLLALGLWSSAYYMAATNKHDPSEIVIDEAAGMMVACLPLLYHFDAFTIILCFVVFRVFDAVKIGPVGWLDDHIDGALGVMMDDIAAGLMAAITVLGWLLWIH